MMPVNATDESLVYEFDLEAPLDKVWHALRDPQLVTQWMLPASSEPQPQIEVQLTACQPPHSIAYLWQGEGEPQSLVTFELQRAATGSTRLRLTHVRTASLSPSVALRMAA